MSENNSTPAARFAWIKATYTDNGRTYERVSGVVDNELGRFAPFGFPDVMAEEVVASVASEPESYAYATVYTPVN